MSGLPNVDNDTERTAWRAKVSIFALKETQKPVEVSRTEDGYHVRSGEHEATLSETDFVEAVTARPTSVDLHPDLRDALVGLA